VLLNLSSLDVYNVTKDFFKTIMVLLFPQKYKADRFKKCFFITDSKDWSNDAENPALSSSQE